MGFIIRQISNTTLLYIDILPMHIIHRDIHMKTRIIMGYQQSYTHYPQTHMKLSTFLSQITVVVIAAI